MTWRGRVAGNANFGWPTGDTAEEFHDMTICNLCCKQTIADHSRPPAALWIFLGAGHRRPVVSPLWHQARSWSPELSTHGPFVRGNNGKLKQESLPSPILPILWNHQIWVVCCCFTNIPFGEWPVGENDIRTFFRATAEGQCPSDVAPDAVQDEADTGHSANGAERANGWILASYARKSRNMNLKNQ